MNPRILELARQWQVSDIQAEEIYKQAHQDGQKQMRERAMNAIGYSTLSINKARIQNLEITND